MKEHCVTKSVSMLFLCTWFIYIYTFFSQVDVFSSSGDNLIDFKTVTSPPVQFTGLLPGTQYIINLTTTYFGNVDVASSPVFQYTSMFVKVARLFLNAIFSVSHHWTVVISIVLTQVYAFFSFFMPNTMLWPKLFFVHIKVDPQTDSFNNIFTTRGFT